MVVLASMDMDEVFVVDLLFPFLSADDGFLRIFKVRELLFS